MSTTPGNVLISYDLKNLHKEVKDAMKSRGYNDTILLSSKNYALPNTTLWRAKTSTDQALADLKNVCAEKKATLEKAVAVLGTDWVASN